MNPSISPRQTITDALRRLLDRSNVGSVADPLESPKRAMAASILGESYNPFVVFNDRMSGRFVQFAGDQSQPLVLDFPLQSLSTDEQRRAASLFAKLGVNEPTETQLYSYPSGEPSSVIRSYQINFVEEIEAAVSATLDLFTFVFQIPEDSLDLEMDEE
jgi:hypothetical protein